MVKKFKIFFLLNIIITISVLNCFETIDEAYKYSLELPEFPPADTNHDYENLKYASFYKSQTSSFLGRILTKLHLKNPANRIEQFFDLLKFITKKRITKHGFTKKANVLTVDPKAQIVLWDQVYAAFHSLVRDFIHLRELGILDNNFKIMKPDVYLVFSGDFIDIGAYSIECLILVLKLMKENEDQIFYINGDHEDRTNIGVDWQDFSLREQLDIYARYLSDEVIPLSSYVNNFFDTLPYALFVNIKNDPNYLAISYYGPPENPFDRMFKEIIDVTNTNDLKQVPFDNVLPKIKSMVKADDLPTKYKIQYDFKSYQTLYQPYKNGQGLYRISDVGDIITWTTVSCPVLLYRIKYDFFYDAFVKIDFGKTLKETTISEFYNTGPEIDFKRGTKYNILEGNIIESGFNPEFGLLDINQFKYNTEDEINKKIEFIETRIAQIQKIIDAYKKELQNKKYFETFPQQKIKFLVLETPIMKKLLQEETLNYSDLLQAYKEILSMYDSVAKDFNEIDEVIKYFGLALINPPLALPIEQKKGEILLGSTADLSRSNRSLGLAMQLGISLALVNANEFNEINGTYFKLIDLDDQYQPYIAYKNILRILNDYKTDLLIAPTGTATLESSIDLIKDKKVFVFFPQSGSSIFRNQNLTNVVNFRASFFDQAMVLTNYMINEFATKNFLFIYQDDSLGQDSLSGAKKILNKKGITKSNEISYQYNITDFSEITKKIKDLNPEAIGFFSSGAAAVNIIRNLGVQFLTNKIVFAISYVAEDITLNLFDDLGLKFVLAQAVPDTFESDLEIIKDYRYALYKNGISANNFALEGFIVTNILIDQIKKITGPITGDKIIKQIEGLKNYNFKGLNLNFDPKDRVINKSVWIKNLNDKVIEQKIDEI